MHRLRLRLSMLMLLLLACVLDTGIQLRPAMWTTWEGLCQKCRDRARGCWSPVRSNCECHSTHRDDCQPCLAIILSNQVTIVPRGSSTLGYAQYLPKEVSVFTFSSMFVSCRYHKIWHREDQSPSPIWFLFSSSSSNGRVIPLLCFPAYAVSGETKITSLAAITAAAAAAATCGATMHVQQCVNTRLASYLFCRVLHVCLCYFDTCFFPGFPPHPRADHRHHLHGSRRKSQRAGPLRQRECFLLLFPFSLLVFFSFLAICIFSRLVQVSLQPERSVQALLFPPFFRLISPCAAAIGHPPPPSPSFPSHIPKVTTGASDDLRRVTAMVYQMIGVYGMGDGIGQLAFPQENGGGGFPQER